MKVLIRIVLPAIVLLAVVGFFSIPTQAQPNVVVDLKLDGAGAQSWNIGNILPGDSGTKTVTLHNAGNIDGFVTIWITDIVSSEGENPEPETNTTGDGELAPWLLFSVSCTGAMLSTDLVWPKKIYELPANDSGIPPSYLTIDKLDLGQTATLTWDWNFPPEAGNEAQGDILSFTINYKLEGIPPPTPGRLGGVAGATALGPCPLTLSVIILGATTTTSMNTAGILCYDCVALDPTGGHILELDAGTQILSTNNRVPQRIELTLAGSPPPPSDAVIVGPIYELNAYLYEYSSTPYPVTISPAGRLSLAYNPEDVPGNAQGTVVIAYYDEEAGKWVALETAGYVAGGVEVPNMVTSHVSHLTYFALLARSAAVGFETSNLTTNPAATAGVGVASSETGDAAGSVQAGNPTGESEVAGPLASRTNWWLVGGLVGAAVLMATGGAVWGKRRLRDRQAELAKQTRSSN